ncbi:MAG: hypothetical protein ACOCP8_05260 [archaeon]
MSPCLLTFGTNTAGIPELLKLKYIFYNINNNINEICSILKFFDKQKMIKHTKRKYNEAKNYDKAIYRKKKKIL